MEILQKRINQLKISEQIDEAINEWYLINGIPVPQWKSKRDPDWWREYLIDLGIDPNNP